MWYFEIVTKNELEVKLATIHCWHEEEDFIRTGDCFTIVVTADEGFTIEEDRYTNVFEFNDVTENKMTKAKCRAEVWREMKSYADEGRIVAGELEEEST